MAMNPFENIFTNLYKNSIFAPPRAVQGAERAASLEAEVLAKKQAEDLVRRQALMRGLQGVAGITSPGTLQRPEVINQVLSNPELMNDLIVKGGLEKPEDFLKVFEGLVAEPFKQAGVSPGEELYAPDPLGRPELIRRNPTTEQVDTKDKQVQAAARAEGIGLLSQWLGKGLTRQQVYEKAIGDKQFRKKYVEEGQGKEESLKTLLELGTPKPLEPQSSAPGTEQLVPNAAGTGFDVAHKTPTAAAQRYAEIETRFGPEVAQELFRLAGPDMNPTEKQTALRELMMANPGNKELEQTARKVMLGVITSSSAWDPILGRNVPIVVDYSQPDAAAPKAPVARPRSPGPAGTGASVPPLGQQPQQGANGQQSPYLPQFTPPEQLPADMTMPAGDAAFELGPAGAVQSFFNNVLAPFGFAKTNVKREDAVAAFNTLADVTREYFQNSGRPLAADVQQVISRLPKSGGFAQGTFQTPLKTLSQLKSLRRQIEKDMTYFGGILAKADRYHPDVVKDAQGAFARGENAIQYFPTDEEFDAHIARAKKMEAEGPKGVGADIMKRWNESFQGGQEIRDFMGGEEEAKETLKEKEERLQRELEALDAPIDEDDPSEMDLEPDQDELPFEPDDDKGRFAPNPNEREKELLKELEGLEELGYNPAPLGDGTFVEPAGQTTVTGPDGQPISIEERRQQIIEELGVIADQKALHKRRLYTELSSVRAAQQTGLPEEVFHAAAGIQSQIAEMTALPAAAVRNALIAVGAAKIMNPEWQSGRSTESLVKDYWASRGNVVDIPEGSMSGKIGEGAFLGATLAYGLAVAGPRLAAAKGPKALNAAKDWIGRIFSESKGIATATGATGGAASGAAGEQAKRMGVGEMGQATAEIAAGIFSPGAGTVRTVSRGGKAIKRALNPPKPQPKMRPEGPGAELVQDFGKQAISASVNKAKAQKGVLAAFTAKDPDKAIDKIFSGPNPEASMRAIIAVTRRSADAREGLRRGVMDWLFRASNLKSPNFTPVQFEKVWIDPRNQRALRLVLPKSTVERLEKLIAAERKVAEDSAVIRKLRPSKKTLAAEGVSSALTGMPGLVYAASILGKVGGSVGMKHLGGRTLVAQSAGAQVGRGAMTKLLSGLSSFASPDALLREALIDPRFEQVLLRKAAALDAAETAKIVRAGRAGSAGAGMEQAFEKDVKTRGVVDE